MAAAADSAGRRFALYRALGRRNRIVGALRMLVPGIGFGLLGVLIMQIVLTSMTGDFSLGRLSIERNRLVVDGPSYAGLLDDGSAFTVTADTAQAEISRPQVIELGNANVVLARPGGNSAKAQAAIAFIDTDAQTLDVPGTTTAAEGAGTTATLDAMHIDFPAQTLRTSGPVHIVGPDGATLDAASMTYDAAGQVWTFERASITILATPGEPAR